jgi:esterase
MELYYREFGQGRPVIILHGMFGFSDNWQTIAKQLSQQYLVVTPDLRNHGRSPHTDRHNYREMADDIRELMENNWMFSAIVVGHSMGGKVAMQLAFDHPEMVEKLVVIDMEPTQSEDSNAAVFQALAALDLSKIANRQEAETILREYLTDAGTIQFLLKNITRRDDGSYVWKMNLNVIRSEYSNILSPVSGPVFEKPALFVRGSKSPYIRDHEWPAVQQLFPKATLNTIEDAGHWVHADQPEALIKVMTDFFVTSS